MQWHPDRLIDLDHGWYLRGDIGYAWGRLDGADAAAGFTSPSDSKLGNGFIAGLGAGVQSKWLRTDVTIDYMAPQNYTGTIVTAGDVTAKISAVSALFNGYLDLGTWYHVTPYLGAGVGAAYVRASDYASTVAPPFAGGSHGQVNFAWALMTGIGYKVASNLMIDVGYRYIDYGDVSSASDAFGSMKFKNLAAHEVRAGVRWTYDDLAER